MGLRRLTSKLLLYTDHLPALVPSGLVTVRWYKSGRSDAATRLRSLLAVTQQSESLCTDTEKETYTELATDFEYQSLARIE